MKLYPQLHERERGRPMDVAVPGLAGTLRMVRAALLAVVWSLAWGPTARTGWTTAGLDFWGFEVAVDLYRNRRHITMWPKMRLAQD
jgi:hypothetical protein